MNLDKELIIKKILYLSDRLKDIQLYNILEPWPLKVIDYIELQNAAKKISGFLGLSDLTFIIAIAKQDSNTAGHIELDNRNEVFIEIDSNSNYDGRSLLAILSHEICHKYLQLENIKQLGRENEILTDVAAIYLGLGKLLINGCSSNNTKVGYLQRSQYAYIYKLICRSRRVPEEIMLSNLDQQVVDEIRTIKLDETLNFYSNEDIFQILNEYLNESLSTHQKTYANLKKNFLIINNLMEALNSQYKDYHKRQYQNKNEWTEKINKTHINESTNYFKNLSIVNEINLTRKKEKEENPIIVSELLNEFIYYLNKIKLNKLAVSTLGENHIIECPNCNHRMSFNKDTVAKIICRKCSHIFIIDTTQFSREPDKSVTENLPRKNNNNLFLKILNIFKKNRNGI